MSNLLRKIKNTLETNEMAAAWFDGIAGTSLYRKFIYYKIRKYASWIKESRRYNVIIETTNLCNARCVMCPHNKMKRKMEVIRDETFDLIVEKLKNEKINPLAFILNGFGDPLTDGKIFERIKILRKEFPRSVVKFYTNLGLANEDTIKNILTSGLSEINVSFNGYGKEDYEKTMGIDYDRTLENLKSLIAERNKMQSRLKIRLSMTLLSQNEGDEKKFINYWKNKADSVSVNKIHSYNKSVEDVSGKNKINFSKPTCPCKYIWNTIVFGTSGDIFLCCLDFEGTYNFGNIASNGILNIYYGEKFSQIREEHLGNRIKNIEMCSSCYTPYRNGVEWLVENLF